MSYKIAIGTSDGVHVDLKFGEVSHFTIYEVSGNEVKLSEIRNVLNDKESDAPGCDTSGCGNGQCGGSGGGCSGPSEVTERISIISDCRCVVCKKIGFQAQKQFEKKAISVFDVECDVSEALDKITFYYDKMDKHISYRK